MADNATDKDNGVYSFTRAFAGLVFRTVMPVRYHHAERLQADPPYVMIANHQHALDPAVMAVPLKKTQVVFLGKKELGKAAIARWFLKKLHCVLVDRHNTDMEAMRACMKTLKSGRILGIFPEGTRHHEGQMEQIESGTALIAMRSGAPVIPLYIDRPLTFFRTTNVYVGTPIEYGDLAAKGINTETCEKLNERFRETFRRMIAETAEKN